MKKLILILLLLFSLSTTVYAHSGGTDAQGGHDGPGGYHYHHGYSAHDHYDMDGDGDLDCPYNFKDNTKADSNTGSNDSIIGRAPTYSDPDKLPLYTAPSKHANRLPKKESTVPTSPLESDSDYSFGDAVTNTGLLIFFVLLVLGMFAGSFSKKISEILVMLAYIILILVILLSAI